MGHPCDLEKLLEFSHPAAEIILMGTPLSCTGGEGEIGRDIEAESYLPRTVPACLLGLKAKKEV